MHIVPSDHQSTCINFHRVIIRVQHDILVICILFRVTITLHAYCAWVELQATTTGMDGLTFSSIVQPKLENVGDVLVAVLRADEQRHHSGDQHHQDAHEALEVTLRVVTRKLSPPGHHGDGGWSRMQHSA